MEMIETVLNGKYKIILPKHRADREEWHAEEGWEKKRLDSMHEHIGKGDLVYYVGAELGEFPALCQMWGAKVVLFEPNHMAWPVIKAVWEANGLEKPRGMFAGFASNKTQIRPPHPDLALFDGRGFENDGDGWPRYVHSEITTAHGFSELDKEADALPQVTIDRFCELSISQADPKIEPPTAICLDVEGAEFEVLRGAEQTLRKYHPKIWLSLHPEFMIQNYGEYSRDLRRWLKDMGYKEELLDYDHEVHLFYHQ